MISNVTAIDAINKFNSPIFYNFEAVNVNILLPCENLVSQALEKRSGGRGRDVG